MPAIEWNEGYAKGDLPYAIEPVLAITELAEVAFSTRREPPAAARRCGDGTPCCGCGVIALGHPLDRWRHHLGAADRGRAAAGELDDQESRRCGLAHRTNADANNPQDVVAALLP